MREGKLQLSGKKTSSQVFEEIEQVLKVEENHISLEKLSAKISLQDITREERMQEASKPLFLKRYE